MTEEQIRNDKAWRALAAARRELATWLAIFDCPKTGASWELCQRIDLLFSERDKAAHNKKKRLETQVAQNHDANTCCCVDCCVARGDR